MSTPDELSAALALSLAESTSPRDRAIAQVLDAGAAQARTALDLIGNTLLKKVLARAQPARLRNPPGCTTRPAAQLRRSSSSAALVATWRRLVVASMLLSSVVASSTPSVPADTIITSRGAVSSSFDRIIRVAGPLGITSNDRRAWPMVKQIRNSADMFVDWFNGEHRGGVTLQGMRYGLQVTSVSDGLDTGELVENVTAHCLASDGLDAHFGLGPYGSTASLPAALVATAYDRLIMLSTSARLRVYNQTDSNRTFGTLPLAGDGPLDRNVGAVEPILDAAEQIDAGTWANTDAIAERLSLIHISEPTRPY